MLDEASVHFFLVMRDLVVFLEVDFFAVDFVVFFVVDFFVDLLPFFLAIAPGPFTRLEPASTQA